MLSAFFSSAETAFSGVNRIKLKNLAADGNKKAQQALKLTENYDELLSTVLVGNNIVNITCTSIATLVFTGILGNDLGVTVSTVVMTVLVLIFGEITPKGIAKEKAEMFAMAMAPAIRVCIVILTPINFLFKQWKKLVNRIVGVSKGATVTEDELITYVEEAQSGGEINSDEGELIRCAIEFNDLDVSDILTPRVDVVAVDRKDPLPEIDKAFKESCYSRLPVYAEDIDHIVGVIHERDFHKIQEKKLKSIRTIIKPVPTVSNGLKIPAALKLLQKNKTHLAVVIDEFGGTMGVVTMEDILEELVGEIWDEYDEVKVDITENEDGSFDVNCNTALDKFAELFDIDEEKYDVATVGGWVMDELGKIPQVGDTFVCSNLNVTVLEAEQRRSELIRVEIIGENNAVS